MKGVVIGSVAIAAVAAGATFAYLMYKKCSGTEEAFEDEPECEEECDEEEEYDEPCDGCGSCDGGKCGCHREADNDDCVATEIPDDVVPAST